MPILRGGAVGDILDGLVCLILGEVRPFDGLPGVTREGLALHGGNHAIARSLEDGDARLALQVAHGGGDARLRNEHASRRLGEAAVHRDLDDEPQPP